MKNLKLIILFCVILLASPIVAQDWYFSIDEYRDAKYDALSGVQRLLIVNNALIQPDDFGHSSVLDGVNQSNVKIDLSKALLYSMFSLTQTLEGSMLDAVELLDISQNSSTNYYSRELLSPSNVQILLQRYNVDALLVLNQLVVYDVLESFLSEGGHYAYLQAFAQSHWSIYYADQNRHDYSITYADTLLWESDLEYTRAQALNQLPDRQEALLYLAGELGDEFGRCLMPSWVTVRRYLYDHSNNAIQEGIEAFRYQRWEEAVSHWQVLVQEVGFRYTKGDKKNAAIAAANISIAYELLGDYALACDYANVACRLFGALKNAWGRQQRVNMRCYLEQLQMKQVKVNAL